MIARSRRGKNIDRYRQIVSVFAHHGFGTVMDNLRVYRYLPFHRKSQKKIQLSSQISPAQHLRLALEELGPTFVKLGQILSTRPDLLPPEYIFELSKLQDNVLSLPWETVKTVLSQEYGSDPGIIFRRIAQVPLGSASLAQVHAAELLDGRQVVIKIQRPNIRNLIDADLGILSDLAALAQNTAWGQLYHPLEIVAQFALTLHNELDYRREGLSADRFRKNFQDEKQLYIPEVFWEYSTGHVLVLEEISGIKIDDIESLEQNGVDRGQVSSLAARILIKEILEDGFFHADPHPGNFVVMTSLEDGRPVIGAMDFGMVGYLTPSERSNLVQGAYILTRGRPRALIDHLIRIGSVSAQIDIVAMERDLERIIGQFQDLPLIEIHATQAMAEIMQFVFTYRVKLPADIWLLLKTLSMMDGLARLLHPDFSIFNEMADPMRRIWLDQRKPWNWEPGILEEALSGFYTLRDIPSIFDRIVRGIQHGDFPFSLRMGATKETLDRLDQISSRLAISLLAAAFVIGLALMYPVAERNTIAAILVVAGFLASLGLGIWVVYSIIRSGKR